MPCETACGQRQRFCLGSPPLAPAHFHRCILRLKNTFLDTIHDVLHIYIWLINIWMKRSDLVSSLRPRHPNAVRQFRAGTSIRDGIANPRRVNMTELLDPALEAHGGLESC